MNKFANVAFLVVAAIVAVAAERLVSGGVPRFVEEQPTASSLEGEVISVEAASTERETPRLRRALVKLVTGETVRASVPGGCVVFPGQTTRQIGRASCRERV